MAPALTDTLTGKLGPLPVWAWGGVIGGTILIGGAVYRSVSGRNSVGPVPEGEGTGEPTESATEVDLAGSSLVSYPGAGAIIGGGSWTPPDAPAAEESNYEWASRIGNEMINTPGRLWSPVLIASALDRFIREQELDANEYAVIEHVLGKYGVPPQPVAPPRYRAPAAAQPAPTAPVWPGRATGVSPTGRPLPPEITNPAPPITVPAQSGP